jgi:hypothetical protein
VTNDFKDTVHEMIVMYLANPGKPLPCRTDSQPDGTVIVREYQAAFSCFSALELYTVNLNTMRFRIAYLGGYTDGRDADSDTPAITIGKCGKID